MKHDRDRAQIVIVEGSIIRPLLQAVRENLRDTKRPAASADEVAATLALVEIEAYLEKARPLSAPADVARLFGPLYRIAAPATFAAANGQAAKGAEIETTLNGIIANAWGRLNDSDLDRMRWMAEGPPYRAIDRGLRLFTIHKTRLDQRQTESELKVNLREEKAANFMRHEDELWTLRQNLDDFKEIETWLTSLTALGKELDEIGDPAAYTMRRATYAEHDARLRKLLPDLPSLLARDIGGLLETAGNPDAAWVAVEDKQRTMDPESDKAIVWAAYLNPAEDGTPFYRKRLDALLKHFPLLNPEDELTRRFQPPDPGQLQPVFLSLAKLVEERAKIADAYPAAPQLPKEEPDPKADPAKARARADASQRLQKRLAELSERGKVITEYLDHGTKDLLNAKFLAGPFNNALKGHQALIFRKPFGNLDPALSPTVDFPRAAAVITTLAGDFAACDTLAVDARHYQLKLTLEALRLRVGDRAATKRSRFETILQAKNAVADEGHAVRTIPVELGPFQVANLVDQKREFKFGPPFFKNVEVVVAKGIRLVKVGRPQAEIGAKPDAKGAPLGELLLSDPIQVVVEWEEAEARGNVVQGGPGTWGTLNFILAKSGSSAAARRQVEVMDALGKKLTLFFTFASAYPAGPRPTGFE
ncbi:MAG: hypothetical protein IAF94_13875 [Pirellulaceae bacterium]|nr:hypothetical protein [Pirellulaceae bacterium]